MAVSYTHLDVYKRQDYLIGLIKETYKTFGFTSMETPCVEHIENLCSKQGGDNEKDVYKRQECKQCD